jgi:hypothetical protein
VIRGRHMTFSGRRWAFLFGVLVAFALPKRVECGHPDVSSCQVAGKGRTTCTPYEVEPFGFYLLEVAFQRDVGFAYSSGEDCR